MLHSRSRLAISSGRSSSHASAPAPIAFRRTTSGTSPRFSRCVQVYLRHESVTVPCVQRGPDPDDWFGDQDPDERRLPDAPADETVAQADDWLDDEPDGREPRPPWTQTIDKRIVTVAVSLIAL